GGDEVPVLAEEAGGDDAADQREEVGGGDEERVVGGGVGLAQAELLGHVEGEDGAHAVVGGPFGELAPEEEPESDRVALEEAGDGVARQGERGGVLAVV